MRVWLLVAVVLWVVVSIAAGVLWTLGGATGLVGNLEAFWAEATGQESVAINAAAVLVTVVLAGLVWVGLSTVFTMLVVVLINAILDLTGGIPVRLAEMPPARNARDGGKWPSPGSTR